MNRSCWNDHPAPILDNSSVGCPFKEPPSVFEDSDSLSSKQIFYRVVVFLVLEHFQLFIIKLVGRVRPPAHTPGAPASCSRNVVVPPAEQKESEAAGREVGAGGAAAAPADGRGALPCACQRAGACNPAGQEVWRHVAQEGAQVDGNEVSEPKNKGLAAVPGIFKRSL